MSPTFRKGEVDMVKFNEYRMFSGMLFYPIIDL